jgi:DNA-directed RNA polymerase specialized sigma24 family protein
MTSHRSHTSAQPGPGLVTSGLGERFETHRPRLTSIAYRMLGSVDEAEDAVQDAWLRLSRADVSTI